ncbi:MAG: DUF1445 domain-containing protein [Clostridiales bacterium]|nr:DUF1445 domain-containing protein [Clostridiales bacterium]
MNIREEIRNNNYVKPTSGVLTDFLQVNIVLIENKYADEFEQFGKLNPKACPIIERSDEALTFKEIGPVDVKRDVPRYHKFVEGCFVEELFDLTDESLIGYIAFAIGCSFTFETGLINSGLRLRHIEENRNVAMYNTDIDCNSTASFSGRLVVSMRPIKKKDINKAVEVTSNYRRTHGIPIHIGNPEAIGIADINQPDYGDAIAVHDDEIPVFWACGVTAQNVLKQSLSNTFYTHAPGHMLITYNHLNDIQAFDVVEAISGILMRNTHHRNMSGVTIFNDIEKFTRQLWSYNHIMMVTGFCIRTSMTGETDGPMSMLLVRALEQLDKTVEVVTDEYTYDQLEILKEKFNLKCRIVDISKDRYTVPDCVLAIERPGKHFDGKYHNMKGVDLSDCVCDTDTMISRLIEDDVPLYALGDGGNEVGMGKRAEYIKKHVVNGGKIVADIVADELLVAGVSNWGSYCITAMLSVLEHRNLLQSVEEEIEALKLIVSVGAVDGVTGKNEMTVDGYSLDENVQIIIDLQNILDQVLS